MRNAAYRGFTKRVSWFGSAGRFGSTRATAAAKRFEAEDSLNAIVLLSDRLGEMSLPRLGRDWT